VRACSSITGQFDKQESAITTFSVEVLGSRGASHSQCNWLSVLHSLRHHHRATSPRHRRNAVTVTTTDILHCHQLLECKAGFDRDVIRRKRGRRQPGLHQLWIDNFQHAENIERDAWEPNVVDSMQLTSKTTSHRLTPLQYHSYRPT